MALPTPHAPLSAVPSYASPTLALALGVDADRAPTRPRPISPAARDALLDALRSERKLLDELVATLRRQRSAVGTDDLQTVDDTVFATHRILATLGQARVRRRQINRLLVGSEDLAARDLEAVLGDGMDDALRAARDELQASAGVLAREVDVNRRLLRDALAGGDAQARALAGVAPVPNGIPAAPANAGVLLNRTA
jgi:hypothetical protein